MHIIKNMVKNNGLYRRFINERSEAIDFKI